MSKRVVFLDLDGVVNTSETLKSGACKSFSLTRYVNTDLLSKLQRFSLDNPDVVFVGVSSWFCSSTEQEIARIADFLSLPLVGRCDYCGGGYGRGISVLNYVEEHELTHWAVLDDSGGFMYAYPSVVVNARIGVTDFDLLTLKIILDTKTDSDTVASYREQQKRAFTS